MAPTPSRKQSRAPPPLPEEEDFGDCQSSPGGEQQTETLDLQSNLLALK
jgi:hypothetical protein